jgi:5-hydroxyisourate hydrolase
MITTHVLDTAQGRPAAGVPVRLERLEGGTWQLVGEGVTDGDGRLRTLTPAGADPPAATYRLRFDTGAYFAASGGAGFYPYVEVVFTVAEAAPGGGHHHVPLLLSPFGYSTYRGS